MVVASNALIVGRQAVVADGRVDQKAFGEYLAFLRRGRNLKSRTLASQSRMGLAYYRRLEIGSVPPDEWDLTYLAKTLHLSADEKDLFHAKASYTRRFFGIKPAD